MYNRYIPDPNGGYVCRQVPDPPGPSAAQPSQQAPAPPSRQAAPSPPPSPLLQAGREIDSDDLLIAAILVLLYRSGEGLDWTSLLAACFYLFF